MKLHITTPLSVVVEEDGVLALRAEDPSGGFGIQLGHAEFLTSLVIGIVTWQQMSGTRRFCAIHGGVLTVSAAHDVAIATREAVVGDDITTLESAVLAKYRADRETERTSRVDSTRLQLMAIRRIVSRLRAGAPAEGWA